MTKDEWRQYRIDRRNGFLRLRGSVPKGIRFIGFVPEGSPEALRAAARAKAPERGDDPQDAA
jgi:hypothetical protein